VILAIAGLFYAALEHVQRTTPQRMEQIGSGDYYDKVMRDHLAGKR
jgi:hypothetical protein